MAWTQTKLYKLCNSIFSGELSSVMKDNGNGRFLSIPINEENADYQEYLQWKAVDGNEPEPAD
tara:strand:- start:188 stop:376 length:189 start_codon:yes stop_codon:yes gene_type:complete